MKPRHRFTTNSPSKANAPPLPRKPSKERVERSKLRGGSSVGGGGGGGGLGTPDMGDRKGNNTDGDTRSSKLDLNNSNPIAQASSGEDVAFEASEGAEARYSSGN